jgi:hypothetical protein
MDPETQILRDVGETATVWRFDSSFPPLFSAMTEYHHRRAHSSLQIQREISWPALRAFVVDILPSRNVPDLLMEYF